MPLDAARWQLEIAAVDKTAQTFRTVDQRMKALDTQTKATGSAMNAGFSLAARAMGPLVAAFSAAAVAQKIWAAGMKAGDLGEQAEQIGLTTDQLQAYRLAAAQSGIEAEQLDAAMMRLARSMGSANEGNDEAITRFEKLGVKVLDANGNLRKAADVMPEVARGLLGISSETERSAMMQELFGRSGARMVTVLEQLARGNDSVVQTAKDHGAVIGEDVIKAWDKLDGQLKVTNAQAQTAMATLGAPIATAALDAVNRILTDINANLAKLKLEGQTVGGRAAGVDVKHLEEQLAAQKNLLSINPNNKMAQSSVAALERRISAAREEQALQESADAAGILAGDMPAWTKPTSAPGARNPISNSARKAGEKAGADAIRESQRQMDELFASFEKIRKVSEGVLDKYGTGAETAARKTEELNEMLQLGYIDVDTFGRAMKDVTAAADDQARAWRGAEGGFDGFLAGMQQGFVEMERMNTAFQFGQDMSKLLGDSFAELATTGELNFNKLLTSFANMTIQMLAQAAALSAIRGLFGNFGGMGGGGGGGGWGLLGMVGGLLGFADGGRPPVGKPSIVGERGAELFVPDQPGTIFNREQLAGMGAPISVTVNLGGLTVGEFVSHAQLVEGLKRVEKSAREGAMAGIIDAKKRSRLPGFD
jgi:hypothetical protein